MLDNFAHIIKEDFSFGLIHLESPKCIKWYGSGFEDDYIEWFEKPGIKNFNDLILKIERKEFDLQKSSGREIQLLRFEEYFKSQK